MFEFITMNFLKRFILLLISFVLVLVYLSYSLDNYKLTLITLCITTPMLMVSIFNIAQNNPESFIPYIITSATFLTIVSSLIIYIAYNQYMMKVNKQTGELIPISGVYKTRYDNFQHSIATYIISSIVVIFTYNNIQKPETHQLAQIIMYVSAIIMSGSSLYNIYLSSPFVNLVRYMNI
jgi:hypothetical protein